MILTISGTPGSGKSTVAEIIAKKLNLKHYSTGGKMRHMAEERKIPLLRLSRIAEKDRTIDQELDRWQIDLGRKEDNFVIDGRLSYHFIPNSIKVFIDADIDERARRILSDKIRKEHNVNFDTSKENVTERETSEKKRYQEYYNLNPYDKSQFDLVIDSTSIPAEEVAKRVIEYVSQKN